MEGEMDVLDGAQTEEALRHLPGWEQAGDAIAKTFAFDGFRSAMLFVERIGDSTEGIAEVAGHHPDIDIRENTVRVAIPKGSDNGWTSSDISLARHIEGQRGEHSHPPGLAGPS
jgi:4a-hydroxytetrahydrobiopterin dehydratase